MVILLLLVVPIALVGGILWAVRSASTRGGFSGDSLRHLFQYALLYGLTVVSAVGLSVLLGRALGAAAEPWDVGDYALAQALGFTVVGVPLWLALGWWSGRQLRKENNESTSLIYAVYLGAVQFTAVIIVGSALPEVVGNAVGSRILDAAALGKIIIWGALWYLHWVLAKRTLPLGSSAPIMLVGSLLATIYAIAGFVGTVSQVADALWWGSSLVVSGGGPAASVSTLIFGALLWLRYWLFGAQQLPRTRLWLFFVLPLGVGGGLTLMLVAGTSLAWTVLVWFLGGPSGVAAVEHFASSGAQLALAGAGLLTWWYFRQTLGATFASSKGPYRTYLYLMSGLGLLAAVIGVSTVFAAAIQSTVRSVSVGDSALNTLILGLLLCVLGGSVWAIFWPQIGRIARESPAVEATSSTRRVYLLTVLWLSGISVAAALVYIAVEVFEDLVARNLGSVTILDTRVAIGIVFSAVAVLAYHLSVRRQDLFHAGRGQTAIKSSGLTEVQLIGEDPVSLGNLAEFLRTELGTRISVQVAKTADVERRAQIVAELQELDGQALVIDVGEKFIIVDKS